LAGRIASIGVFVCRPSETRFEALLEHSITRGSFDGADQGLLNVAFEGRWKRIPFLYNTCPGVVYSYAPAYRYYKERVKVLHFLGSQSSKPWYALQHESASLPSDDYQQMIHQWWLVHDQWAESNRCDTLKTMEMSHSPITVAATTTSLSTTAAIPWAEVSQRYQWRDLPARPLTLPKSLPLRSKLSEKKDEESSPSHQVRHLVSQFETLNETFQ
jgi:lipopolysaccharide biosynthesis glycosyltransferase